MLSSQQVNFVSMALFIARSHTNLKHGHNFGHDTILDHDFSHADIISQDTHTVSHGSVTWHFQVLDGNTVMTASLRLLVSLPE